MNERPGEHPRSSLPPSESERQAASSFKEEIKPLELDFSELDNAAVEAPLSSAKTAEKPPWLLPSVAALLLLAAVVVFVLPKLVGPPKVSTDVTANPDTGAAPSSLPQEISPWQQAQLERERKAAQDVLELLLEKQADLETLNVRLWAEDRFLRIIELAETGDTQYRQRLFSQATLSYTEADSIADELLMGVGDTKAEYLRQGLSALENNVPELAKQAFDRVLSIDPKHAGAQRGLERLMVLDDVQQALQAAAVSEEQQQYATALQSLRTVIELDADLQAGLQARIEGLEQDLLDFNFAAAMSQGYRSFDGGQVSAAIDHFNQAAKLKPDAAEPKQALRQVRNQRSLNRMAVHFDRAARAEDQEQWATAVKAYQSALDIDAKLSDASSKKQYAEQRVKMDKALQTLNDDPLRLADASIYQKALKLYAAGRQIDAPGPRLSSQLNLLDQQIKASRKSTPVLIQSDGLTQVSVQRVASLGAIASRQLNLKPGRYVAIGVRDGYRDVRKEFIVPQGAQDVQVDVRCVEQI